MKVEDQIQARLERIRQAVALERPDKIPVVLEYSGFAAYVTHTSMAEFVSSPAKSLETMIRAYLLIGDGDAINYGSFWPYGLCYGFMSKVRVPGVDLPDDAMWQVDEKELMTRGDYDRILERGWPEWFDHFMKERVLNDVPAKLLPPELKAADVRGKWAASGIPVLSGGDVTTPIDGETNLFEAKKLLGDHMCIMGDVPASMLFLDTPEQIHEYSTKLIRELGPAGFILQSGCDIPANTKLENVQAMVAAAVG